MWNFMHRKPGAPWEDMYQQYSGFLNELRMSGDVKKGDVPEINSMRIWYKLLKRLLKKEYHYDVSFYGDFEELTEKVAYFFHANLQGVEASPKAARALLTVAESKIHQGILADAQPFTLCQMLRAISRQDTLPELEELFTPGCVTLSFPTGARKPSKTLFETCLKKFQRLDIPPESVLHVSNCINDDLAIAKQLGMKTALYAEDKVSLKATRAEVSHPETKPDRLMTDLLQIRDILQIG